MRDSFIFHRYFYEAISILNKRKQGDVIMAVLEWAFENKSPNAKKLGNIPFALTNLIIDLIDKQGKRGWFKGARSNEVAIIRSSNRMAKWRKAVFARDNYTCQKCGQRGKVLNAHHVKPFSVYPNLRFDIDNGITLCKQCHIKLHKIEREWETS